MDMYDLDPEISAFLQKSSGVYPDDAVTLGVEQNRKCYDRLCELFQSSLPAGITTEDSLVEGRQGTIPVRTYTPTDLNSPATAMYLHGGGFILGGLESHDSICADIAYRVRIRVVAVDYRLAPEYTYPAQFEDALDVFLAIDNGRTIIVGDSAGASLSASVCVAQRQSTRHPVGQVLIYPALGGQHLKLDSYRTQHDAPALTTENVEAYTEYWSGGEPPWSDPCFAPLVLEDMSGMPPCVAVAAEYDPLRDDAVAYVRKLEQAGVPASCHVEKGLVHGYLRARYCSEKAAKSFERICSAIARMADL